MTAISRRRYPARIREHWLRPAVQSGFDFLYGIRNLPETRDSPFRNRDAVFNCKLPDARAHDRTHPEKAVLILLFRKHRAASEVRRKDKIPAARKKRLDHRLLRRRKACKAGQRENRIRSRPPGRQKLRKPHKSFLRHFVIPVQTREKCTVQLRDLSDFPLQRRVSRELLRAVKKPLRRYIVLREFGKERLQLL